MPVFQEKEFRRALRFVLKWEGGFSNTFGDRGGPTNYGITQRTYRAYRKSCGEPFQSVRYIERAEMEEIYMREYWARAGCHDMPTRLALLHFDSAVQHGVKQSVRFLQRAVNRVCLLEDLLKIDGLYGYKTESALEMVLPHYEKEVIYDYLCDRLHFYYRLALLPNQWKFAKGWLRRLRSLERLVA